MNILDVWLLDHFERLCFAIDMLPVGLNFEVSEQAELQPSDPKLATSRSGLSQHIESYGLGDARDVAGPITPETTIQTGFSNLKKNKTN